MAKINEFDRNTWTFRQKKARNIDKEYYSCRSLFGNTWAFFYILLGAREAGKSYDVMRRFLVDWKKKGKPFTWLRLTEASQRKMLTNKAEKLIDPDLQRKFDLELTVKGCQVYDHGKPMCKVLALSTFYNDKGVALFDNEYALGYNICLDEMNRELNERKTFDITYAFVNQMENLVRSTKENMRIVLIGNTLEEASDILCCFNFVPEEYGRYYLRKKRAVIDYIPPSEKYLARRKGTIADLLTPESSTFTNKIDVDKTLLNKGRLKRPQYVIAFDKQTKFTVWDNNTITTYNGEQVRQVPMRPYLDMVFNAEARDLIIALFDSRSFLFRNLITQKKFKKELELLKPRK